MTLKRTTTGSMIAIVAVGAMLVGSIVSISEIRPL
jgi:hypothetical protein